MNLIPETAGRRILELAWNPDTGTFTEVEAPVLAWELAPDPRPVHLLGELRGAWAILEPYTGQAYIPAEAVFSSRAECVRELRHQARLLAGADQ